MISSYLKQSKRDHSSEPSKYTAEETLRLQEIFRPTAEKYHHHRRIAMWSFGVAFSALTFTLLANGLSQVLFDKALFPKNLPWYVTALMYVSFAILGWAKLTSPRLRCPGCSGFLDKGVGRHCPECGSDRMDTDLFGQPHCEACDRTMKHTRHGRRFRIRNCTTCGLLVDSEGL